MHSFTRVWLAMNSFVISMYLNRDVHIYFKETNALNFLHCSFDAKNIINLINIHSKFTNFVSEMHLII